MLVLHFWAPEKPYDVYLMMLTCMNYKLQYGVYIQIRIYIDVESMHTYIHIHIYTLKHITINTSAATVLLYAESATLSCSNLNSLSKITLFLSEKKTSLCALSSSKRLFSFSNFSSPFLSSLLYINSYIKYINLNVYICIRIYIHIYEYV
jgi:hypothetical protein